jgi:hypothetical protein
VLTAPGASPGTASLSAHLEVSSRNRPESRTAERDPVPLDMTGTADRAVLVPAAREPGAPAGTDPDLTAIEVYAAEMTAKAPPLSANARAVARLTARAVQTSCSYGRSCRQAMRTVRGSRYRCPGRHRGGRPFGAGMIVIVISVPVAVRRLPGPGRVHVAAGSAVSGAITPACPASAIFCPTAARSACYWRLPPANPRPVKSASRCSLRSAALSSRMAPATPPRAGQVSRCLLADPGVVVRPESPGFAAVARPVVSSTIAGRCAVPVILPRHSIRPAVRALRSTRPASPPRPCSPVGARTPRVSRFRAMPPTAAPSGTSRRAWQARPPRPAAAAQFR